jgi:hypothetical protein
MRHIYELSPETIKTINGHAGKVAEELDVSDKHVYAILAGTETDPFAKFSALYAASVRAGCDVSHWLRRLDTIRAKYYRMEPSCVKTETAKSVKEFGDVVTASIEDKPLETQLIETDQAIAQLEIQRKAIISQIAAGQNFNGKPVSYATRHEVRMRIAK